MVSRRFRHQGVSGVLATIAVCSSAGLARAGEPGPSAVAVSVTDVQTPDAVDQAEALTKALRAAVRATPGWSLAKSDVAPGSMHCAPPTNRPRHWSLAPPARDPEKAKALIYSGDDKLAVGDSAGALAAYQAGDDIMRVPSTGIGIARVLLTQNRFAEAADFARWVADEPVQPNEAPVMAEARREAKELAKTASKRAASMKVLLDKGVVGASTAVFVDGILAPLGDDPGSRLVSPGKHTIMIAMLGYSGSTSIAAREGERLNVPMTLSEDPPTAACQANIADRLEADHWVWGTLAKKDKKGGAVTGNLHLWMRGKGTSHTAIDYDGGAEPSGETLRRVAVEALAKLTGGPPKGAVQIHAGDVAGQVFVDEKPLGALMGGEGTFMLAAGPHTLTVKATGYADYQSQIVVKPNGPPLDLSISMAKVDDRAPVDGRLVGGIAALGAGVAFGVVGLVSLAQVKSAQASLDSVHDKTVGIKDVCAAPYAHMLGIEIACSKGKTFQVVQIVTFPLAAIALGLGTFFIVTGVKQAPSAPKASWMLLPQVGPTGGTLDFRYRF